MYILIYPKRFEAVGFTHEQARVLADTLWEVRKDIIAEINGSHDIDTKNNDISDVINQIKDVETEITLLTERIKNLPYELFNKVFLSGSCIVVLYKMIEFIQHKWF